MKHLHSYNQFVAENLKDYMKQFLSIGLGPEQEAFFKWKYDNAKNIKTKPYTKDKKLSQIVSEFLTHNKIEKKQCYYTAYKMSTYGNYNIEYIEGEISVHGVPVDHAWNKYKNIYFDLTNDVAWEGNMNPNEYLSIIEIDRKTLTKLALRSKTYGPFLNDYFVSINESLEGIPSREDSYNMFVNNFHSYLKYYKKICSNNVCVNKILNTVERTGQISRKQFDFLYNCRYGITTKKKK